MSTILISFPSKPLLVYSKANGRLLAADSDKQQFTDRQGRPFPNVIGTTIKSQNPPNLAKKQPGHRVQIIFDVADLNELTMLRISGTKTLKVFLPFEIIAAATGQRCLIPSLNITSEPCKLIGISCLFYNSLDDT